MTTTIATLPHVHHLGLRVGIAVATWWLEVAHPVLGLEATTPSPMGGYSYYYERLFSILFSTIGSMHWWSNTVFSLSTWMELATQALRTMSAWPGLYRVWWWNLVRNDPIHVLVETTLLLSVVYILVSRSYDWRELEKIKRDELTPREENELIHEWKHYTRAPLTPPIVAVSDRTHGLHGLGPKNIIVHKMNCRTMDVQIDGECGDDRKPESNADALLADKPQTRVRTVLNFATFDFLGMSSDLRWNDCDEMNGSAKVENSTKNPLKEAAKQAMLKYGCGSCGPRGFYGTMDVHLQMEQEFAKYLKTDAAIMYSDGASACSSTIAAFAKRGDLLIVDEGVNEPLRTGVTLSRAHVKWFQHNNMDDLKRVLQQVAATDKQLGRKPNAQRRFIVVEGLYRNTGAIVPLDVVVKLKHEYSCRLILDESLSFGALGRNGRGVTEIYADHNIRYMHDIEIVTISLENAVGSIGGLSLGNDEIVDHQRISGSGYCFSASTPPFAASAALAALSVMQDAASATNCVHSKDAVRASCFDRLQANRRYLHKKLQEFCTSRLDDVLLVTSDERAPLVLLQLADVSETEGLNEMAFLQAVNMECILRGVAFVVTGPSLWEKPGLHGTHSHITSSSSSSPTANGPHLVVIGGEPPPGLRITVSAAHTFDDVDDALCILGDAVDNVMNQLLQEATSVY
jgi:7-keto-8-aminopelargonate synthetase-like enzyme